MSTEQPTAEKCDSYSKRSTHFCFYGLVSGAGVGIVLGSALDAIPLGLTRRPCYWASNRICLLSAQILGRRPHPAIEIVSIYVEQVRENDLSRERVGG